MLEKVKSFLKNTFTYQEESTAQTPTVKATPSPQEERKPAPAKSSAMPGDFVDHKSASVQSSAKYNTDPQVAAQQQTNNFAALRPKPEDTQFRMIIDKVFYAKGGGVVVRGNIGVGVVKAGNAALIVHAANKSTVQTKVIAIERDGKVVNYAPAGSTVGLLLETITRNDVHSGDVIGGI